VVRSAPNTVGSRAFGSGAYSRLTAAAGAARPATSGRTPAKLPAMSRRFGCGAAWLAIKFLLNRALQGGAARSLRSGNLGKTIAAALSRMEIEITEAQAQSLPRLRGTAG
jgi:hypothetical protein